MPQQTFHLVPTTLARPNAVPNKPMTSKAAKEAYRKANKGPKISRAEQRRLDAEELGRQKKEFERERNAVKAKAARDKKLEKEKKAREERKKRGEPEPKKGVGASQPTIKGFVGMGKGKRGWEDLDTGTDTDGEPPRKFRALEKPQELETDTETEVKESGDFSILATYEALPKRRSLLKQDEDDEPEVFPSLSPERGDNQLASALETAKTKEHNRFLEQLLKESKSHAASTFSRPAESQFEVGTAVIPSNERSSARVLQQREEEDDFGDFPSLSQTDFGLFDTPVADSRIQRCKRTANLTANANSLLNRRHLLPCPDDLSQRTIHPVDGAEVDFLAESQLLLEASVAADMSRLVRQQPVLPPGPPKSTLPKLVPTIASINLKPKTGTSYDNKVANKPIQIASTVNCTSKDCLAPRITPKLTSGSSRRPFGSLSGNILPPQPPFPSLKSTTLKQKQTKAPTEIFCAPPPSTMAFLEAHLDDFFPSPSQQVRELLEDIDDIPSNTQIAREIEDEPLSTPKLLSIPRSRAEVTPKPPIPQTVETSTKATDDLCLNLFSSQDFEISSQDLRDIDTPRKAVTQYLKCPTSAHHELGIPAKFVSLSPKARPSMRKPRFFEEKEEDLLHAALQESLAMAKQEAKRLSLEEKRLVEKEKRSLKRAHSSAETDYGDDDIDYDGFNDYLQSGVSSCVDSYNFGDYADEMFEGETDLDT